MEKAHDTVMVIFANNIVSEENGIWKKSMTRSYLRKM